MPLHLQVRNFITYMLSCHSIEIFAKYLAFGTSPYPIYIKVAKTTDIKGPVYRLIKDWLTGR